MSQNSGERNFHIYYQVQHTVGAWFLRVCCPSRKQLQMFGVLPCVTSDLGPQLLAGSSGEQRENLGVTTPDYYFYLNQSGSYTVEDVNDKKEFSDTMVTTALVKPEGGASRCPLLAAGRIAQT